MSNFKSIYSRFFGLLTTLLVVISMVVISMNFDTPNASATTVLSKMVGFNGRAWTLTEPDSNGTRYIGGDFTSYNPWLTGTGAWTDPTSGQIDPSFSAVNGDVFASVSDGAGGLYIAGSLSSIGGVGRNRVAHILGDGSLDAAFLPPSIGNEVWAIDVDSNYVYIGGKFTTVNSQARGYAARLDRTTGALDAWNPNANSWVHTINVDGSNVYLGGRFTTVGGVSKNEIAKVDNATGAIDSNFASPITGGYGVFDITKSNGYTYVGGSFSATQSGTTIATLVRLDETTGALDTAWNPSISGNTTTSVSTASNPAGPIVYTMDIAGSTLYVGGKFTSAGGQSRQRLAAFDLTGTPALTSWAPTTSSGGVYNSNNNIELQDAVSSLDVASGTVYISGGFFAINGVARNRAGAINATTGSLSSWDPHPCDNSNGAASHVRTVLSNGTKVFIGGTFTCAGGLKRYHTAAVGADGILTNWTPEVNAPVQEMSSDGTTIYMVGRFTNVNDNVRQYAAAVQTNGTTTGWSPALSVGLCGGGEKQSVLQTSTYVYVGGCFTTVNGVARTGVAATDPSTGTTITTFNANVGQADVRSLAADSSKLYLGGAFTTVGGLPRTWIAAVDKLTGAVDTGWDAGTLVAAYDSGVRKAVHSIKISPQDSRVYIGGWFGTIGGVTQRYLAALNQNTGALVTTWQPQIGTAGSGGIFSLSLNGNKIYFGGSGTTPVSGTAFGVADTTSGAVSTWMNSSGTGEIRGIAATDAAAFVVGEFGSVAGQSRSKSAAIDLNGTVLDPWPMDSAENVPVAVNITASGVSPGAVISSPGGINCGGACTYGFASSTSVTLTAVPVPGSDFGGWGGACSSLSTTCTLSLQSAATATASFVQIGAAPTQSPSPSPSPSPSVSPSQTNSPNTTPSPSANSSNDISGASNNEQTPPISSRKYTSQDSNLNLGESKVDQSAVEHSERIEADGEFTSSNTRNSVSSSFPLLTILLIIPITVGLLVIILSVLIRRKKQIS